jgi:hypothetical protein
VHLYSLVGETYIPRVEFDQQCCCSLYDDLAPVRFQLQKSQQLDAKSMLWSQTKMLNTSLNATRLHALNSLVSNHLAVSIVKM